MPLGRLSARIDDSNDRHHLWLNNGTWWVHYTLNFDFRTRRVRRSLETPSLAEAIRRRDALFERLVTEGEWVLEREPELPMPAKPVSTPEWTRTNELACARPRPPGSPRLGTLQVLLPGRPRARQSSEYARVDSNHRPWDEKVEARRFRSSRRNHEIDRQSLPLNAFREQA